MRNRAGRFFAASAAAAAMVLTLSIAGCAARPEAAPSAPSALPTLVPTPIATSVLQAEMPIASFELTPTLQAQEQYLQERLLQACMAGYGFHIMPDLSTQSIQLGVRISNEVASRWYGISDLASAEVYGYQLPSWTKGTASPGLVSALPTGERSVMIGGVRTYGGRAVPEDGCTGTVQTELTQAGVLAPGPSSATGFDSPAEVVQDKAFTSAQRDARVEAVFARWSACMATYGDHYATPFAPTMDPRWENDTSVSPAEIDTAEHDIACKTKVNLLGVELAVVSDYQNMDIMADISALAGARAQVEGAQAGITKLMARYAG